MSKFFSRIGTKAIKFSFEVQLKKINLAIDVPLNIIVIFKRGTIYRFSLIREP